MKVKLVETVSQDIYENAKSLDGFSFYHTENWHNVLKQSLGFKVQAYVGEIEGNLLFFMPVVLRSSLFGNKKSCLPLSHYCGVAYNPKNENLLNEFLGFIDEGTLIKSEYQLKQSSLESTNIIAEIDLTGFSSENELLKSFQKSSIQRKISKAYKSNIEIKRDYTIEAFDIFYEMEVETRIRQGSPIYPKNFFSEIFNQFEKTNQVSIHIAYFNKKPSSGIIFFHDLKNKSSIYAYGASFSDNEAFKHGVNQVCLWDAIKLSFENGFNNVDLGSSPKNHTGLIDYKKKWGAEAKDLVYTRIGTTNRPTVDRGGKKAEIVSSLIGKLPKPIFKAVTPMLIKQLAE